jgi:hypothetical protein
VAYTQNLPLAEPFLRLKGVFGKPRPGAPDAVRADDAEKLK